MRGPEDTPLLWVITTRLLLECLALNLSLSIFFFLVNLFCLQDKHPVSQCFFWRSDIS